MRGLLLYSRSRRIPWVIGALLVVGAAASAIGAVYVGMSEFGDMALLPTVVLGPLPAAVLVLVTIDEPSREIALAGTRPFATPASRARSITRGSSCDSTVCR